MISIGLQWFIIVLAGCHAFAYRLNPQRREKQQAHRHAKMSTKLKGVNYGGRFLPEGELFSYPHFSELFRGVSVEHLKEKDSGMEEEALCDLDVWDAGQRMKNFLDAMIKEEHFSDMAGKGFNVVRLPLGYWNLINLPGDATPSGPSVTPKGLPVSSRWRTLQRILPAEGYRPYIDRVFNFAKLNNLKILLDFHGAPGQQSGNKNTGCDLGGGSGPFYFDGKDEWNNQLGVLATEALAEICNSHGDTCYGLELLNEPFAPWITWQGAQRSDLQNFYLRAIAAARNKMSKDTPIVISDWPKHLPWWKDNHKLSDPKHGHIMFSTHLYAYPNPWTTDLSSAQSTFQEDMNMFVQFAHSVPFQVMVTEYGLNSHGRGDRNDRFDYQGLTKWFVHSFSQHGLGSFIWNYDAHDWWGNAWGPVKAADWLGSSGINWHDIWNSSSPVTSSRREGFDRIWGMTVGACWHAANSHAGLDKDKQRDLEQRDFHYQQMVYAFEPNDNLKAFAWHLKHMAQDLGWHVANDLWGNSGEAQQNKIAYEGHMNTARKELRKDNLFWSIFDMIREYCWYAGHTRRWQSDQSQAKALLHKRRVEEKLTQYEDRREWPLV